MHNQSHVPADISKRGRALIPGWSTQNKTKQILNEFMTLKNFNEIGYYLGAVVSLCFDPMQALPVEASVAGSFPARDVASWLQLLLQFQDRVQAPLLGLMDSVELRPHCSILSILCLFMSPSICGVRFISGSVQSR
jgi:hypothetical protein